MKTWKKIEETKKRTNDITNLKKRNEEKVQKVRIECECRIINLIDNIAIYYFTFSLYFFKVNLSLSFMIYIKTKQIDYTTIEMSKSTQIYKR